MPLNASSYEYRAATWIAIAYTLIPTYFTLLTAFESNHIADPDHSPEHLGRSRKKLMLLGFALETCHGRLLASLAREKRFCVSLRHEIPVKGSGGNWKVCSGPIALRTPTLIRFGQETEDEIFITHEAATRGVEVENTGNDPLVSLRYFGPDAHKYIPSIVTKIPR